MLRLKANEEWETPGKEFSFLFPTGGLGAYLVGPQARLLNPGDVLVANGDPKGRLGVRNGGEVALRLFSVSFEHLYPLFASRELGLLAEVSENLKPARLYGASTAVARECHRLLKSAPPRLDFDHRAHLLRVAATVLSEEIKAAQASRGEQTRPGEHVAEAIERLSASEILNLSVEDLARKLGFCRRHLNRLFHQYLGVSVSRLRMEMRLLKAVTLLRDPDSKIINVAEGCGFNHLGQFNASFNRRLCAARSAGFCPFVEADDSKKCPPPRQDRKAASELSESRGAASLLASRRARLVADRFDAGGCRAGSGAGRAAGFAGGGRRRRGAAAGGSGNGLYDQAG